MVTMSEMITRVLPFVFIVIGSAYMIHVTRDIHRGHYLYPLRVHFRALCAVALLWRGPVIFLPKMPAAWQEFYRDGSMSAIISTLLGTSVLVLASYIKERTRNESH